MPELPEVEAIRIQLEKFLKGAKIQKVEVKNRKIFEGDERKLVGAKIKDVRRFAKVISVDLSNKLSILVHVKLTGQIIYRGPSSGNSHARNFLFGRGRVFILQRCEKVWVD